MIRQDSAEEEVQQQIELRMLFDDNERKRIAMLGKIELAVLSNEDDEAHAEIRERIAREARELDKARRRRCLGVAATGALAGAGRCAAAPAEGRFAEELRLVCRPHRYPNEEIQPDIRIFIGLAH